MACATAALVESNRSPPANGVDLCENDADRVWGKPRTFQGIRINASGLAPPTECGDQCSKFVVTAAVLGDPSRRRGPAWPPHTNVCRPAAGGRSSRFLAVIPVRTGRPGRGSRLGPVPAEESAMAERQVTTAPHGHILTNAAVWSPDGAWLVYDVRSDAAGSRFDGTRIERVEVATGRVEVLHESVRGACCGVATTSPVDDRVVFILGPEDPTPDWTYGPARRRGVVVDSRRPGHAVPLDARDLVAPFTPGALRGGSHVHQFSPDGRLVSFTYEDALLDALPPGAGERNLRAVGVSVPGRAVEVPPTHPRNHSGGAWSVLVTDLADAPAPGGDGIVRACEEAWIGAAGYLRADGARQRPLVFQGTVVAADGREVVELFVCDLPDDEGPAGGLDVRGTGPLCGTAHARPRPPAGVGQRRLTFTTDRVHPGVQGPRHWPRSNADGTRIAFLARDERGIVQVFTVAPLGGAARQVTAGAASVDSAFTWTPDGTRIACVIDGCVCLVDARDGAVERLTARPAGPGPRPEACVVSPDGRAIAFVRPVGSAEGTFNQVFVVEVPR